MIRYYLFNDQDAAEFKRRNVFAGGERESELRVDSVKPFKPGQEAAVELICRRMEGVCQVRLERTRKPAEADMHLLAADFGGGTLGRIRDYQAGPTQVIVANRVFTEEGKELVLDFKEGGVGYGTLMHEMLHAMGLSHPKEWFRYRNGKNGTVMSYSGEGGSPAEDNDLGRYDIAALQHLYGAPPAGGHPSGLPLTARQPRSLPRCRK